MESNLRHHAGLPMLFLAGVAALLLPLVARAQTHSMDPDAYDRAQKAFSSEPYGVSKPDKKPAAPEPYNGQIFCPVTGVKLGLNGPAVAVQTSIGETKPGFLGKCRGETAKPGAVIYVCCPECATKVRRDPQSYLSVVILDRGTFAGRFSLATAPNQRPPQEPVVPNPPAPVPAAQPVSATQPK